MSDAEATAKPVEAGQPTEEKPVEQVEEKTEEKTEAAAEEKTEDKTEDKVEDKAEAKPETEAAAEDKSENKSDEKPILKTSAKIDYENHRNNRKFDPSTREVTDDPVAIRKQVEFYFSDWNFAQDKFMWESCGGTENKPMKIKTLHSFKRMRSFQPYSAVVAALKDSSILDVTGEEGEEEVKRKEAYKPMGISKAKTEASTIYAKGFGDENPDTQFDLESFFAQFGEVRGLKLRRTNENLFKGSVFVTFADEETANKFVALDPAPKWKEHDLKIMSKRAYVDEKNELIKQGKLEPNTTNPKKFYEGKESGGRTGGRGGGRGGRGGRDRRDGGDPNDWKRRRENDQKNGFRDRRGGGRGGRGRGGRGNRDRDGGRDDRRGDRRGDRQEHENKHNSNDTMPRIQSTADDADTKSNGKRARDDDASAEAPAAKKVDAKEAPKAEAS